MNNFPTELMQILSGKILHDIASSAGVVANGYEILEEGGGEDSIAFAKDLLREGSSSLVAKVKFYRLLFSAKSEEGKIKTNELIDIINSYFSKLKVKFNSLDDLNKLGQEIGLIRAGIVGLGIYNLATLIMLKGEIKIEVKNQKILLTSSNNNIFNSKIDGFLNGETADISAETIQYLFTNLYSKTYNTSFNILNNKGSLVIEVG
ncbi:MAG: hypothetical protein ACK5BE_03570 [Alphaproteobacteria bacterium]|jgi:hypothetical protein